MDNNPLMRQLKNMVLSVVGIEQELRRLDMLELEILAIKSGIQAKSTEFRNAICALIGGITAYGYFDNGFERAHENPDTEQECTYTAVIDIKAASKNGKIR